MDIMILIVMSQSSTPVYAIANGKVTYKQAYRTYGGVKYLTSYGNYIEFVSSDKKYSAKYCHLSKFANGVSQKIKKFQNQTGKREAPERIR